MKPQPAEDSSIPIATMSACCRGNGNGRCIRCSCMKARRLCVDCLPSRKNQCCNQAPSDQNSPDPVPSSSTVNGNGTTDNLERILNPSPAVTAVEPVDAPTIHPVENLYKAQTESPVANPTDLLPPYFPIHPVDQSYRWGSVEGTEFLTKVDRCFDEVVHWQRNVFSIPTGKAGKNFVSEMARLFQSYAEGSQIESFSLTAAMILPSLILQKPFPGSKTKEHVKCVERHMIEWRDGDIDGLLQEGHAIQQHLHPVKGTPKDNLARSFVNLMMHGRVKSALRLLSSDSRGTPIALDKVITSSTGSVTVRGILQKKCPSSRPVSHSALLPEDETPSPPHPILFDSITDQLIRTIAMRTEGAAGPSGMDAADW